MDVPNFVQMEQDLENNMVMLSVDDANVSQQKEMWGELLSTDEKQLRSFVTLDFEC